MLIGADWCLRSDVIANSRLQVRASNDYIALLVGLENPPTSGGASQPGYVTF